MNLDKTSLIGLALGLAAIGSPSFAGLRISVRPSTRQEASCERKLMPRTSIVPMDGETTTFRFDASISPILRLSTEPVLA